MLPQQYCLRWKYHHSNLQTMFSQLLDRGCFCDVTLACEGQLIRAHRVVLCACSTFFDTVLTNYASERDPIIIMKDVTFADVKALIEFMYKGEINVEHANLASLLKTADDLKIKGLAEVSWRDDEDVANGVSGGAPPPPADTEYSTNSPQRMHDGYTISAAAPNMRGSPIGDNGMERKSAASPIHNSKHQLPTRLPMLTPIPSSSITIATASSADHYLGPKRKRGRPPLDDAYDVFNVRKLTHYAGHLDSQPFHDTGRLHATQHEDQQQRHSTSAYQQHIHQQQRRQRQKNEQKQHAADSDDADDNQTDPEWITSNLEVNVAECEAASAMGQTERESNVSPLAEPKSDKLELNEKEPHPESSPAHNRERSPTETKVAASERNSPKAEQRFKKRSVLEKAKEQRQRESKEREKMENKHNEEIRNSDHEDDHATLLPQPVEEIESAHQQKAANASSAASATNASSASSSELPSTSSQSKIATNSSHSHTHGHAHSQSHAHSHGGPSISATHGHAHAHFGKYGVPGEGGGGAGGYVLNEHGMLMTHDFSTHGGVMAAATSNGDHDFVDIKMEDYDAADLRLTSEEMSQWQDVIKMDDYLAKGRRPQFWEEPFTRRVLDAIKNKRLEMKKAARILGVSYGTLYGRYREVYGCLKHPYSSTMRPSQSSQLAAVQPRFDIVWPSPKRDSGLLPAPLEIGKIRPKDLSELWARPQI